MKKTATEPVVTEKNGGGGPGKGVSQVKIQLNFVIKLKIILWSSPRKLNKILVIFVYSQRSTVQEVNADFTRYIIEKQSPITHHSQPHTHVYSNGKEPYTVAPDYWYFYPSV